METISRSKKRKLKRVQFLREFKHRSFCSRCGEKRSFLLQFHHTNPSNKIDYVSRVAHRGTMVALKREIAKCIVLCDSCHRKAHEEQR